MDFATRERLIGVVADALQAGYTILARDAAEHMAEIAIGAINADENVILTVQPFSTRQLEVWDETGVPELFHTHTLSNVCVCPSCPCTDKTECANECECELC